MTTFLLVLRSDGGIIRAILMFSKGCRMSAINKPEAPPKRPVEALSIIKIFISGEIVQYLPIVIRRYFKRLFEYLPSCGGVPSSYRLLLINSTNSLALYYRLCSATWATFWRKKAFSIPSGLTTLSSSHCTSSLSSRKYVSKKNKKSKRWRRDFASWGKSHRYQKSATVLKSSSDLGESWVFTSTTESGSRVLCRKWKMSDRSTMWRSRSGSRLIVWIYRTTKDRSAIGIKISWSTWKAELDMQYKTRVVHFTQQ